MPNSIICRFTRDLRLDDQAALAAAAEHGAVVAALVLDEAFVASVNRSPRRTAFYCGAVAALAAALRERGGALVVRRGECASTLVTLARECNATGVAWSASYGSREKSADAALRSAFERAGLRALCVHDAPAVPPEETAHGGTGYRSFQPYFERWREVAIASYDRPLLTRFVTPGVRSHALPEPKEYGANHRDDEASPGTATALLERFVAGPALAYASARSVPAQNGTSRLGAHLSLGTISLRAVVRAVLQRHENPFLLAEERLSLRTFLRSLAMRDFFLQLSWFRQGSDDDPLQERMRGFPFANEHAALDAWREGRTGFPLVDAGMRQLAECGWMHPHVRAVAASFLCFDLGVDWRIGRETWDRLLVEDDPAIATGNWQWIAGVGADLAQYPRIYNPMRQQRRFDPESRYIRRYVEELRHLPSAAERLRGMPMLPIFDGAGYPRPVVDHDAAARSLLERYHRHTGAGSGVLRGTEKA